MNKKDKTRFLCYIGYHAWKHFLRYSPKEHLNFWACPQEHYKLAASGWDYCGERCVHCRAFKPNGNTGWPY